jgi:CheY-like chemotaxis protein
MIDLNAMSILIVDDMEMMRRSIRNMLKTLQLGETILHASNGKEAWQILNRKSIDLAIVDWNMPVMNGIELLHRIREDKIKRDMPVIMITAEADMDIVIDAAESDIDAYILKPLTVNLLDEKIRTVVEYTNDPLPERRHLLQARACEEKGDIDGAIREVKLALRENPSASRILRKLGLLYIQKDNFEFAEKCIQKAIAINQRDGESMFCLARLYLQKDELQKSLKYFQDGMRLNPRNIPQEAIDLGGKLLQHKMNDEAVDLFRKIIKHSGKVVSMGEKIADICLKHGAYDYACEILKHLITVHSSRTALVYKAGIANEKNGNIDKALQLYTSLDQKTGYHIDAKIRMARIYINKRKVLLADDLINEVLKIHPDHQEALALREKC